MPGTQLVDAAAEAASGGVNLVQLREKDLPTRELLALAERLQAVLQPLGVPLVVNGRADVAFAASAAGVHLPADGLVVSDARAALGDAYLVGRSVHSANEARQSATEDLDYVVIGTIFPSPSHVDSPTIGVEGVRAAVGARAPLIGIGGITPENAGSVIEAGADGVAVISAILGSSDPRAAAQELSQAVSKAWNSKGTPSPQPSPRGRGGSAYAAHR
jgi:thiamine-phosphate pyrophosphorylase